MPLGAEDEKPADRLDPLCFGADLFLVLAFKLAEHAPTLEPFGIVGHAVTDGVCDRLLVVSETAHLALRHELGVAPELDIGTAPRHVGRDGDGALFARLRDDLGFTGVMPRVQDDVLDPVLF